MKRRSCEVGRRRRRCCCWSSSSYSQWLLLPCCVLSAVAASIHRHHSITCAIQSSHQSSRFVANRWDRRRFVRENASQEDAVVFNLRGGGEDNAPDSRGNGGDASDFEVAVDTETEQKGRNSLDDASEGKTSEKMAYSLSGIDRKVNEDVDSDDSTSYEAKLEDVDLVDDTQTEANTTKVHYIEETGVTDEVIHVSEGDIESSVRAISANEADETSADTTIDTETSDRVDKIPDDDTTPFPLSDLSDKLQQILSRNRVNSKNENKESAKLRDLVLERCEEYIDDVRSYFAGESGAKSLRHPKKLLHFLAPKIPAIKKSPDITLRIKSAKADVDGAVAAYVIGSIACMTELYEQSSTELLIVGSDDNETDENGSESFASDEIISDRRFGQLVECMLCGMDAKAKLKEIEALEAGADSSVANRDAGADGSYSSDSNDIREGLCIKDTAFAAYGLAVLGTQGNTAKIGGYRPREIFSVLSLHCRDMLLTRRRNLGEEDAAQDEVSDLVSDVASALWAFSCVKSITGHRSDHLFDVCCSTLLLREVGEREVLRQRNTDADRFDEDASPPIENSNRDIVDATAQNCSDIAPAEPLSFEDTLVARLSQTEVINTLWALAIHGSSDNKSLHWRSEGAAARAHAKSASSDMLADLLLGRMQLILEEETIKHVDVETNSGDAPPKEPRHEEEGEYEQEHLPRDSTEKSNDLQTQHMGDGVSFQQSEAEGVNDETISSNQKESLIEEEENDEDQAIQGDSEVIQVVSATAILEEEARQQREGKSTNNANPIRRQDDEKSVVEVIDVNTIAQAEASQGGTSRQSQGVALLQDYKGKRTDDLPHDPDISTEETKAGSAVSKPQMAINDMCSIAWAATELSRDTSICIVWQITILYCFSRENFMSLGGTSLSNLAWAIAKGLEASNGSELKPHINTIVNWIAERSLAILSKQPTSLSRATNGHCFQPPELSRLLWSICLIDSSSKGVLSGSDNHNPIFRDLASSAMKKTASDLPVFSVEDLARILWAFSELCNTEPYSLRGSTANSFGQIQETIEASLLRWESGQKNVTASQQHKDSNSIFSRFPSTFFGKSRALRLSLLDVKISLDEDEDDEEDAQHSLQNHKALPTLSDLTVDPATLCKLAFGLAQISRSHQQIVGSEQILRVATRLFSSKNGRLLSECSHKDVIRMCCACVDTMKLAGKEIRGSDREYVLRQFPRRVVQLINSPVHHDSGIQRSYLKNLSPSDLAALLFSLGELGVRASYQPDNPQLEYRKLRMVPACPILSEKSLETLTPTSSVNLFCGLVAVGDASKGNKALLSSLCNLQSRVDSFEPYLLCRLTASLSKLLRSGNAARTTSTSFSGTRPADDSASMDKSDQNGKIWTEEDPSLEDVSSLDSAAEQVIDNLSPPSSESLSSNVRHGDETIRHEARHLLDLVLQRAATSMSEFSGEQIRRFLLHVVLLPFQADDCVDAADTEVGKRLLALNSDAGTSSLGSIQDLSKYAADAAVDIAASLSHISAGDHPFKFLRKGGKDNELASEKLSDVAAEANRVAASACEAAARLDRVNRGANLNGEGLLQQFEHGAAFELGRCQALIGRYRRIVFSDDSFSRRSRYDDERRKIIGKRVCSRLFV